MNDVLRQRPRAHAFNREVARFDVNRATALFTDVGHLGAQQPFVIAVA